MLETSIFSFSHNVFYPSENKFQIFNDINFCRLQLLSIYTILEFCRLVKSLEVVLQRIFFFYQIVFRNKCFQMRFDESCQCIFFTDTLLYIDKRIAVYIDVNKFVCKYHAPISFACINPLLHRYSFLTHQLWTAFENIVGKGKIARNEQFLLFPQCFLLYQIIVSSICPCF